MIFLSPILIILMSMARFGMSISKILWPVLIILSLLLGLALYYESVKPIQIETTKISFDLDYGVFIEDSEKFMGAFKQDIAKQFNVNEQDIIVYEVAPGSVNIHFRIKSIKTININKIKQFPNLEKAINAKIVINKIEPSIVVLAVFEKRTDLNKIPYDSIKYKANVVKNTPPPIQVINADSAVPDEL